MLMLMLGRGKRKAREFEKGVVRGRERGAGVISVCITVPIGRGTAALLGWRERRRRGGDGGMRERRGHGWRALHHSEGIGGGDRI